MASIRDIYRSSDTLAASDLPVGVQVPVVIEAVRGVQFDDGNKLELRFHGKHKVLMCNKTNAMRIADQWGDDYDLWLGKAIYLQRDKTEFKGQLVECVRVARPAAVVLPPPPAPVPQPAPVQSFPINGVSAEQTNRAMEHSHQISPGDIPF